MVMLETGKTYRPIMGRPTLGEDGKDKKAYGDFLLRFLGFSVINGIGDVRAQLLNPDGTVAGELTLEQNRFGKGPGLIYDLELYVPELNPQVEQLLDCSVESTNLELTCDFCGEVGSADIDDHEDRPEKARSFYDEGWRSAYSAEYEVVGIACPTCMLGENDDVSGLKEQI